MRDVWILLKVQLLSVFGLNQAFHTKGKQRFSRMAIALVMCLAYLCIGVACFAYVTLYAEALDSAEALSVLPGLLLAVTCFIVLFFTVYTADGTLYRFRDYDTILSLPVKVSHVVASRVLMLVGVNLFFALLILIPGGAAYAQNARPDGWFYPSYLLCSLFAPLLPVLLATAVGTLIGALASRFRHSNIISLVLFFLALMGLTAYAWTTQGASAQAQGGIAAMLAAMVNALYPPAALFSAAVQGSLPALLLFCGGSLLLFLVACFLLALFFRQLNGRMAAGKTRKKFRLSSMQTATPFRALFRKEWRRYWKLPLYVCNTIMGAVLLVLFSAALLFLPSGQLEALLGAPELSELLPRFLPLILSFFLVLDCTTASSISLEGKNLWILRSAPVDVRVIFHSKLALNLLVNLPAVAVSGSLLCVALRPAPLDAVFLFLVPASYCLFTTLFGLFANLRFPNFNWSTEMTVIKQSLPVLLVMFSSFITVGIPLALSFLFPQWPAAPFYLCVLLSVALLCILLYHGIQKKGAAWFAKF